jgi:dTDP-4-dehydrorhamnose reductase
MILVFGKTGQVAQELQMQKPDALCLGRDLADLSDPAACGAAIRKYKPKAVINAAAYTGVDRAEEEEALASIVNGDAPKVMAETCAELGIPFVHISTDYVFEGGGSTMWKPQDMASPLSAYGRSKFIGEQGVSGAGGVYAILRTSWVFSAHGNNFVKTMLRLSETRDALSVVDDQIGGPTPARDIAIACLKIADQLQAEPSKSGIYHFSGAPDVSWKDLACEVFAQSNRSVSVTGIPSIQYPTPAVRPLNSRMDCTQTSTTFGIDRPDWAKGVADVLKDLKG